MNQWNASNCRLCFFILLHATILAFPSVAEGDIKAAISSDVELYG